MNVGTKSLLFGGHQIFIHPPFVYTAWIKCYKKLPNWRETICIVIHDWGYWGKPNMDGTEGEEHTKWAAYFAAKYLDGKHLDSEDYGKYYRLCLFHSRFQARKYGADVSKLCLPDKIGVAMMPTWLWVLLCSLSSEIKEYMKQSKYEINQNAGPSGIKFQSKFEFFKAYKAIAKKWFATGDVSIKTGNTVSDISKTKI